MVLVETLIAPAPELLVELGPPTAVLPHEILAEGVYVHAYLDADRGLVLSVAEPYCAPARRTIVRCRGLGSLDDDGARPGPELYRSFEDRHAWSAARA